MTGSAAQFATELKNSASSGAIEMTPATIKIPTNVMTRAYSTALLPLSSLSKDRMKL